MGSRNLVNGWPWLLLAAACGCSGSESHTGAGAGATAADASASGGANLATGGSRNNTGGTLSNAGNAAVGAVAEIGGSNHGAGGIAPSGGFAGVGGALSTGGSMTAAGGATETGGSLASGGAKQIGGSSFGGSLPSGGSRASTGGVAASGGVVELGGAPETGGTLGIGGTGGRAGTGGTAASCEGQLSQSLQQCSGMQVQPLSRLQNLLLVLDTSGSMNNPAEPSDTLSKWQVLASALSATLSAAPGNLRLGLEMFPYDPSGPIDPMSVNPDVCCQMPTGATAIAVEPSPDNSSFQSILDKIGSVVPAGGSPMAEALLRAYAYFTTGNGQDLSGPKWVLLVTDGAADCNFGLTCSATSCTQNLDFNCGSGATNCCDAAGYLCLDDTSVISAIAQLATAGINTYVVGLPGSDAYTNALNSYAVSGGEPNPNGSNGKLYYAADAASGVAGLQQILETITGQLAPPCDIPLTTPVSDVTQVNVTIDCAVVPRLVSDGGTANWSIDTTQSPEHLKLSNDTCNSAIRATGVGIELITGCGGLEL